MSTWGHMSRLGDARLTRAAMDVTARGFAVTRLMFFGPSPDAPPEPPPTPNTGPRTIYRRAAARRGGGARRRG